MNKVSNVVRNIREGYQPIIKAGRSRSFGVARPLPPKGGSGVPNLLRHSVETMQDANNMHNNR